MIYTNSLFSFLFMFCFYNIKCVDKLHNYNARIPQQKITYKYIFNKQGITQDTLFWEKVNYNPNGQITKKIDEREAEIYSYNPNGKLSKMVRYSGEEIFTITYNYGDNIKVRNYLDSEGKIFFIDSSFYNSNQNIVKRKIYNQEENKLILTDESTYEYLNPNNLSKQIDYKGGNISLMIEYQYNKLGKVECIKETHLDKKGNVFTKNQSRFIYQVLENGYEVQKYHEIGETYFIRGKMVYNMKDSLINKISYRGKGEEVKSETEYIYNSENQLICESITDYVFNFETGKVQSIKKAKYYKYDGENNVIEEKHLEDDTPTFKYVNEYIYYSPK